MAQKQLKVYDYEGNLLWVGASTPELHWLLEVIEPYLDMDFISASNSDQEVDMLMATTSFVHEGEAN